MTDQAGHFVLPALPFEPAMMWIPSGSFVMGTGEQQIELLAVQFELARVWREKGRFSREQPQHTVALNGYWIGRYPVTVGQYRAFLEAGGYARRSFWTRAGWAWCQAVGRTQPDLWDDAVWAGDDRLPVVGVSWFEAYAYCQWLGEVAGRDYRLPSEAEWEKAARGTDGRPFPWGDLFDPGRCNTRVNGLGRTQPVGHCSPAGDSPYGCAEMVGNVSEWTASWFVSYPYRVDGGREDPAGESERVTRGGSWHSPVLRARTVSRGMNDPFFTDSDLGFRCACSV
jgi:formylglycine-generating enzyme required for sulfatase activity